MSKECVIRRHHFILFEALFLLLCHVTFTHILSIVICIMIMTSREESTISGRAMRKYSHSFGWLPPFCPSQPWPTPSLFEILLRNHYHFSRRHHMISCPFSCRIVLCCVWSGRKLFWVPTNTPCHDGYWQLFHLPEQTAQTFTMYPPALLGTLVHEIIGVVANSLVCRKEGKRRASPGTVYWERCNSPTVYQPLEWKWQGALPFCCRLLV